MQWTIRESPNRTNLQEINTFSSSMVTFFLLMLLSVSMRRKCNYKSIYAEEMLLIWANIAIRHPERFGPVDGGVSKQHVIWFLHSESPPFHFLTLFSAYFFFYFHFYMIFFLVFALTSDIYYWCSTVCCVYIMVICGCESESEKKTVCAVHSRGDRCVSVRMVVKPFFFTLSNIIGAHSMAYKLSVCVWCIWDGERQPNVY